MTPQFVAPTPEGYRDVDFDHFYDSLPSSGPLYLPQLNPTIGDPSPILNIPLRIDADAPFILRSMAFERSALLNFSVRLRDPFGNFLMPDDQFIPSWLFFTPSNADPNGGGCAPLPVIDPEIYCPPQSVIYLDIATLSTSTWAGGSPGRLILRGVKRYKLGDGSACGGEVVCGG